MYRINGLVRLLSVPDQWTGSATLSVLDHCTAASTQLSDDDNLHCVTTVLKLLYCTLYSILEDKVESPLLSVSLNQGSKKGGGGEGRGGVSINLAL